eukprot:XP_001706739.1 Hypothetical protein GL50803_92306 [Giardia lamblia ATCC 50803]
MAVLLCLGDSIAGKACGSKVIIKSVRNIRGTDKIVLRQVEIAIIEHHAHIKYVLWRCDFAGQGYLHIWCSILPLNP